MRTDSQRSPTFGVINRMTRTTTLVVAMLLVALALVACGDDPVGAPTDPTPPGSSPGETESPVDGDDLESLIAAAQEEGSLVWYTSGSNAPEVFAPLFEARYGVKLEFIRLTSPDVQARFNSESEAGIFVADVVSIHDDRPFGGPGFFQDALDAGFIIPLEDAGIPGLEEFPQEWVRPGRVVTEIRAWGFGYNTDLVSSLPETWADVIDEQYFDRILLADPRASDSYIVLWNAVLEEYGEEWFEGFRALQPRLFASGAPATEALGAGEGALQVPASNTLIGGAVARGAPVGLALPDINTGTEMAIAMGNPDRIRSPNAARLFIHWMMSEEPANAFNEAFPPSLSPVFKDELEASGYQTGDQVTEDDVARIVELLGLD